MAIRDFGGEKREEKKNAEVGTEEEHETTKWLYQRKNNKLNVYFAQAFGFIKKEPSSGVIHSGLMMYKKVVDVEHGTSLQQ